MINRASLRPGLPFLLLLLLGACAAPFSVGGPATPPLVDRSEAAPTEVRREPVSFAALPDWNTDDHSAALRIFAKSCHRIARGEVGGGAWQTACADARALSFSNRDRDVARRFFEARFVPHRVTVGGNATGLVTGYFEPVLKGAWRRSQRYQFPLYRVPPDLVSVDLGKFRPDLKGERVVGRLSGNLLVPYATRREIRRGLLAGQKLEMLWLDDPVDAFFLHIQGSGRVKMDDGQEVRVGFAGRNGHAYHAIGRDLIAAGLVSAEKMSLQAIRAWLRANPNKANQLMDRNRSFIFFRQVPGAGPVGAMGVVLQAGRSLAVDRTHIPLGAPVWLDTVDPLSADQPLRRLMIAQDTGSAIKGAARGDYFWGSGTNAEAAAGRMRHPGQFYLLLPRPRPKRPLG